MSKREPYRSTNAAKATDEHAARALGYKSQLDLDKDRERQSRYIDDAVRRAIIIPTRVMSFYAEAVAANTVMRRAPKTATVMTTTIRYPLGAAGKIIGASIWCSSGWTTGTASLQVRISKGGGTETNYTIPVPGVIDGLTGDDGHVRTQSAEWVCPVPNGIRFAAGEALRVQLLITGWTVSTPDWGAEIIVAYDGLSGR
jgi:hypothetical protein